MNASAFILGLRPQVRRAELLPTIILITSAVLPAMHRHLGSIDFVLGRFPLLGLTGAVYSSFAMAAILMGLIPAAILRWGFDEKVSSYGLRLGDWKAGLKSVAVLYPLITVALLLPASQTAEMRAFYPLDTSAGYSAAALLLHEFARLVLFYVAWEFFFRGYMLFGLRRHIGDWMAICIQTIPQCLWHIGCPSGELFSSIAAGILFGILAIRTRSILWPLVLHVLIGVTTDVLIVLS